MYQHDYIKRQIEQFAQLLARVVGLRSSGDLDAAMDVVRKCYRALGLDPSYLRLGARSLLTVVPDRQKLLSLCELLEEESRIHAARGNMESANECRQRAEQLRAAMEP